MLKIINVPEKTREDHMVGFFFRIVTTLNMANEQWRPRSLRRRHRVLNNVRDIGFLIFFCPKLFYFSLVSLRYKLSPLLFVIIIIIIRAVLPTYYK